jgi:hypothetical protein
MPVALEIIGSRVSLYLREELADSWSDQKPGPGGVGFFEDRNAKAQARMIHVSYGEGLTERAGTSTLESTVNAARVWWGSLGISRIL